MTKQLSLGIFGSLLLVFLSIMGTSLPAFEGPKQGKGIRSKVLGEVKLGPEIKGMEGRKLRYRYWWIEPNGIIPVHGHIDRPALIYMLKGEIIEHRSDSETPHVHKAGDTTLESAGVLHWWENKGDLTVELIAADICNAKRGAC